MNIYGIVTDPMSPVSPQTKSPASASAGGPEGSMPPLAAFNTLGGESMDIRPDPEEDTSDVGGHGEVGAVAPAQPVLNSTAAESTAARPTAFTVPPRKPRSGKRVSDYLATVRKRVQTTDSEFQRLHLPYRFRVESDNKEQVLLVLSVLDKHGKVIKDQTRDVTNEDFGAVMDDISSGIGLVIDDMPQRR